MTSKELMDWTRKRLEREQYEYGSKDRRQMLLKSFVVNSPQGRGFAAAIPFVEEQLEKDWNLGRFDKDLDRFRKQVDKTDTLVKMENLQDTIRLYRVPEDMTQSKENIARDLDNRLELGKRALPRIERTVVVDNVKYEQRHYPVKFDASGRWRENVKEWYRVAPSGRKSFASRREIEQLEQLREGREQT